MRETQLGPKGGKRWRGARPKPEPLGQGYNELKQEWQGVVGLMLRRELRFLSLPLPVPVVPWFSYHERDRKRDPDGVSAGARKIILDALVEVGALPTDGASSIAGFGRELFEYPGDPNWRGQGVMLYLAGKLLPGGVTAWLPVRLPDWNELREAVEVGVRRQLRRKGGDS